MSKDGNTIAVGTYLPANLMYLLEYINSMEQFGFLTKHLQLVI